MILKKMIQAVMLGLFCAVLILFVVPLVNKTNEFNLFRTQHIESYHGAVEIASPAVVNVYNQSFDVSNGIEDVELQINNLGSGVIMTASGYILTNKHVIQNADQIIVALQSGSFHRARLVGSDSLTDLAVLKIEAEDLPTIPQNDRHQTRIGDVVLAIGNPLNLGQSITQGIVSAIGRNTLSETGRQHFIQTDASINKGNSGGALINTLGELIGINTLSLGKNSKELAEGLNFAIPINIANKVMNKIIKDGRVIRGYIGVNGSLFNPMSEQGVYITGTLKDGPAERAGLIQGDLIIQINETMTKKPEQMMDMIADMQPGSEVKIVVLRQGILLEFNVIIGEFPEMN